MIPTILANCANCPTYTYFENSSEVLFGQIMYTSTLYILYISRAAVLVKWCSTGVLALSLWCKDTEISLFRVIASQSSVYFTLKYFWDKNACYILNLVHRKLLIVNFNGLSGPVMKLLNILINMYYIIDRFCK